MMSADFLEIVHCLRQGIFRVGQWSNGQSIYNYTYTDTMLQKMIPFLRLQTVIDQNIRSESSLQTGGGTCKMMVV